jgi:pimeloyl-ACP methyl ester carboxylesterase
MEQQKNIDTKHGNLHYSIAGQGKAVILLHGFAEDGSIFSEQVAFLQHNNLVIIPDLPGTGQSAIMQKRDAKIADYAEIIKAIADEEKIEKFTLIGHSVGGYISLAFAKKYPELLTGVGLLHSTAYADDEAKIATRKKAIKFIEENGTEAFLKTSIPTLFYDAEKSKSAISSLVEKGKNILPGVLIQQYNAMIERENTLTVLERFPNPILMVIGEHDKAIPFDQSLQQTHLPQTAYIHILRHSGHMGMKEETEKVNKILAEFLQSV